MENKTCKIHNKSLKFVNINFLLKKIDLCCIICVKNLKNSINVFKFEELNFYLENKELSFDSIIRNRLFTLENELNNDFNQKF